MNVGGGWVCGRAGGRAGGQAGRWVGAWVGGCVGVCGYLGACLRVVGRACMWFNIHHMVWLGGWAGG